MLRLPGLLCRQLVCPVLRSSSPSRNLRHFSRLSHPSTSPSLASSFLLKTNEWEDFQKKNKKEKKDGSGDNGKGSDSEKPQDTDDKRGASEELLKDEKKIKNLFDSLKEKKAGKEDNGGEDDDDDPDDKQTKRKYMIWIGGGLLGIFALATLASAEPSRTITWPEFLSEYLARDLVTKLEVVNKRYVRVFSGTQLAGVGGQTRPGFAVCNFKIGSLAVFEEQLQQAQQTLGRPPEAFVPVSYMEKTNYAGVFLSVVPEILFLGMLLYYMRGMTGQFRKSGGPMKGLFMNEKAHFKMIKKEDISCNFTDVAGLPEAKQEIQEFVDFLKHPKKYEELGAKIPKGAMLVGPPGTGKTLLAKATAGEAGVPFFSTTGSDFVEMFVGVGPSRVRELFAAARKNKPCIIFIDEIDAIGGARGGRRSGGNDERENTLNQMLVEMDGFTPTTGVVVLAGTNRPEVLDSALTRPGRFDRQIAIDNPDLKSREEIFVVHLKPLKMKDTKADVAGKLAALTPGFSGADIANVCNEAALIAARGDSEEILFTHFEAAIERVIGGLEKKNKVLSSLERKTVAIHEVGHAVVSWFLEHAAPLLKVSIIPRGRSMLGHAQYQPKDQYLLTKEQLVDSICLALGGRAAEALAIGTISTGAQDDLQKVTNIAYSQVSVYGMNDRVGPLSFPKEGGIKGKPYSEETAELMDEEVRRIINEAYNKTVGILTQHLDAVNTLAQQLLEKEVLRAADLESVLGPRPYPIPPSTTINLHESPPPPTPPLPTTEDK